MLSNQVAAIPGEESRPWREARVFADTLIHTSTDHPLFHHRGRSFIIFYVVIFLGEKTEGYRYEEMI